jgi:TPR repeat protein
MLVNVANASQLTDSALRLIQVGTEIGSPDVVLRGHSLLLKGAFDLNDLDALYETSKQARFGNELMGYAPQNSTANELLLRLVMSGYDKALYEYGLYLLDGDGGVLKDELMALNLFERSFQYNGNPRSAFVAAIIRNESLVPGTNEMASVEEMLSFAILKNVKGALNYRDQHVRGGSWRSLNPESWREWLLNQ